ncbi:UNVERIFIED_ORG: hypothetical protein GGD58_000346 [Rhizobium pisi]
MTAGESGSVNGRLRFRGPGYLPQQSDFVRKTSRMCRKAHVQRLIALA